jgi:hypothetical protein
LDYLPTDIVFIGLVAALFIVILRGIWLSLRKRKSSNRQSEDPIADGAGAAGGADLDEGGVTGDGSGGDGGGD